MALRPVVLPEGLTLQRLYIHLVINQVSKILMFGIVNHQNPMVSNIMHTS